jgi:aspartate ammonia-lyase
VSCWSAALASSRHWCHTSATIARARSHGNPLETNRRVYELVLAKAWLTQRELDDVLSPDAMTKPRPMPVLRSGFDGQDVARS